MALYDANGNPTLTTGAMGITVTGKAAGKGSFLMHEYEGDQTGLFTILESQLDGAAVQA